MVEASQDLHAHPRLPFSAPGALKALELGFYGNAVAAVVAGALIAAELPVAIALAPLVAGPVLTVLGYGLGRRSQTRG